MTGLVPIPSKGETLTPKALDTAGAALDVKNAEVETPHGTVDKGHFRCSHRGVEQVRGLGQARVNRVCGRVQAHADRRHRHAEFYFP